MHYWWTFFKWGKSSTVLFCFLFPDYTAEKPPRSESCFLSRSKDNPQDSPQLRETAGLRQEKVYLKNKVKFARNAVK